MHMVFVQYARASEDLLVRMDRLVRAREDASRETARVLLMLASVFLVLSVCFGSHRPATARDQDGTPRPRRQNLLRLRVAARPKERAGQEADDRKRCPV